MLVLLDPRDHPKGVPHSSSDGVLAKTGMQIHHGKGPSGECVNRYVYLLTIVKVWL